MLKKFICLVLFLLTLFWIPVCLWIGLLSVRSDDLHNKSVARTDHLPMCCYYLSAVHGLHVGGFSYSSAGLWFSFSLIYFGLVRAVVWMLIWGTELRSFISFMTETTQHSEYNPHFSTECDFVSSLGVSFCIFILFLDITFAYLACSSTFNQSDLD